MTAFDESRTPAARTGGRRAIRVPEGLFVLRYASAEDRATPPRVAIAAVDEGQAALHLPPGMSEPELLAPGDGLVIQAHRDVVIAYDVERAGGAHLTLEPVSSLVRDGREAARGAHQPRLGRTPDQGRRAEAPGRIVLLGHVARRGDISARPGEWLGGPDAADPIEGVELRWADAPLGLDVALRVTVNHQGQREAAEAGIGVFAGSRRRAAPIVGIDLALQGRRPEGWLIDCQAIFLGQPLLAARGARIALRGKTGWEPLVGLRIAIGAHDALPRPQPMEIPASRSASPARRVRIFRPSA